MDQALVPVVVVANLKGGVGKTFVSGEIGIHLARMGNRVCLVDLDPQGNLTHLFRQEPDNHLDLQREETSADWRAVRAFDQDKPLYTVKPTRYGRLELALDIVPGGPALSALDRQFAFESIASATCATIVERLQHQVQHRLPPRVAGALSNELREELSLHLAFQLRDTWRDLLGPTKPEECRSLREYLHAQAVAGGYHVVVVDTPPTVTSLLVEAIGAATHALVVTEPTRVGKRSADLFLQEISRAQESDQIVRRLVGIVVNMYDKRSREQRELVEAMAEEYGSFLLDPLVPLDRTVMKKVAGKHLGLPSGMYGGRMKTSSGQATARLASLLATRLSLPYQEGSS